MDLAFLFLVFIAIIALEAPRLIKSKMWKELGVFSVLLLLGAGLSFAMILDIPVPNPTSIMEKMFAPITIWMEQVLS